MSVEDRILELLAEDEQFDSWTVAAALVDQDVSRGEYDGCSSELEMAFAEYQTAIERVKADLA